MEFNAEVARGIARGSGANKNIGQALHYIEVAAKKGLFRAYVNYLDPTQEYHLKSRGFNIVENDDSTGILTTLITWTPEDY